MFRWYLLTILLFSSFIYTFAQSWQQIGNLQRPPRSMLLDTIFQRIYVSGGGVKNGSDTINGLFYLEGSVIHPLGKERHDCGNVECNPINTMSFFDNKLIIGGSFEQIGSVFTNGIAALNNNGWNKIPGLYRIPSPNLPSDTSVSVYSSLVKDDSLLYVSGLYSMAGADTCYSVAVWNGYSWKGLQFIPNFFGKPWPVYKMCFYKDELYVTGSFEVELDGNTEFGIARLGQDGKWHSVGGGMFGGISDVFDMVVYKDELYLGGTFTTAAGNAGNKIMRWNGASWHDVGGGFCGPSTVSDLLIHEGKLYAAGLFSCVGNGLPVNSIATWDGEKWCTVGNNQVFNNRIAGICILNSEMYVTGGFTKIGDEPVKYFAKYAGSFENVDCTTVDAHEERASTGEIKVFPNPVNSSLSITWEGVSVHSIELVRPDGKHTPLISQPAGSVFTIDTAMFPAGIYIIRMLTNKGSRTEKIVIGN